MERYANKQNLVQLAKAVHDKYSLVATPTANGLMLAEDKAKLDGIQRDGIASLTAKGHAEQDGTPTPDSPVEIQVVRGRNLLRPTTQNWSVVRGTLAVDDGRFVLTASATDVYVGIVVGSGAFDTTQANIVPVVAGEKYVLSSDVFTTNFLTWIDSSLNAITFARSDENGTIVATAPQNAAYAGFRFGVGDATAGVTYRGIVQFEHGASRSGIVPYGHVGMEVQGRNLLQNDGYFPINTTTVNYYYRELNVNIGTLPRIEVQAGVTYTLSLDVESTVTPFSVTVGLGNGAFSVDVSQVSMTQSGRATVTFTPTAELIAQRGNVLALRVPRYSSAREFTYSISNVQLELGSVAHDYEPYYYATKPIPLPQRGWVASLPDGTADVLTLDGAGKVEWELETGKVVFDGSSDESWCTNGTTGHSFRNISTQGIRNDGDNGESTLNVLSDQYIAVKFSNTNGVAQFINGGVNIRNGVWVTFNNDSYDSFNDFKASLAQNPVTVLYPLATPITENCGYVEDWPTDIPEGAVITIPELDALGVKYYVVGGAAATLAHQWYERARSEYEGRITNLESAVAQLIAEG